MNDRDGDHSSIVNQVPTGFVFNACLIHSDEAMLLAWILVSNRTGQIIKWGRIRFVLVSTAKRTCMMHSLRVGSRLSDGGSGISGRPEEGTCSFRTERPRGAEAT